jgi:hypothetical protein
MKKLLVLFLVLMAGCTTMFSEMRSWEGRTVDELYWDMGSPDKIETLEKGYRVFIWEDDWTDSEGEVHTCRKSFTAYYDGHEERVTDADYSDCQFMTVKSR